MKQNKTKNVYDNCILPLKITFVSYQSKQVGRNWTMMAINGAWGKKEFWFLLITALLTRKIAIDLSRHCQCVLNKDFARSKLYNHRISSGGKGFCESLCPSAPRKRASKWDQTIRDLYQVSSGWLLSLIFSVAVFHHPYCVNSLSFSLVGTSLDSIVTVVPCLFALGLRRVQLDKTGIKSESLGEPFPCISRKLSSSSTLFSSKNKF